MLLCELLWLLFLLCLFNNKDSRGGGYGEAPSIAMALEVVLGRASLQGSALGRLVPDVNNLFKALHLLHFSLTAISAAGFG